MTDPVEIKNAIAQIENEFQLILLTEYLLEGLQDTFLLWLKF